VTDASKTRRLKQLRAAAVKVLSAAFLQQIEECGSLPRSRYAGFAEVSRRK